MPSSSPTSSTTVLLLVGPIITTIAMTSPICAGLKVMALNVWGMPAKVGSEDKELRMEAIGKFIQQKEYDVYLLAELWMRPDHETIRKLVPHGKKIFLTLKLEHPIPRLLHD